MGFKRVLHTFGAQTLIKNPSAAEFEKTCFSFIALCTAGLQI